MVLSQPETSYSLYSSYPPSGHKPSPDLDGVVAVLLVPEHEPATDPERTFVPDHLRR